MNRKTILLNVLLLALVGMLIWILRTDWSGAKAREAALRVQQIQAKLLIPPPPLPMVKPIGAAQYFDVADKTLFSKDRNPAVVVEPPPPPPAPPPMPDLPNYHGQMSFGSDPIAFLSTGKTSQRSYHFGDTIGDFKVVRFDREKIAFAWQGKTIERKLEELRPKDNTPPASQAAAAATPTASTPRAVSALTPAKVDKTSDDPILGPELGGGDRACVQDENSPSGAVHSGYRKVSMVTLLGPLCHWEPVK